MVDSVAQKFDMPVTNQSGFIVLLPCVGSSDKLIQQTKPDPYSQSASQLFPLGTKLIRGEQVWRYCYAGDTNLDIAAPVESPPDISSDEAPDDILGLTVTAIGSNIVYLTSTGNLDASPADEINEFAEGYLYFNDEAGQGQCRKIKSNVGFTSTDETKFVLYEDLTIATVASTSLAGVVRNPYWMVEETNSVATGMCVGVPGIPVTLNYWFWSQTGGPCAVVPGAAIAVGTSVVIGTTDGVASPGSAAATEIVIGWPMSPGITPTEEMLVFLTLD